jgi:hypothetical protein
MKPTHYIGEKAWVRNAGSISQEVASHACGVNLNSLCKRAFARPCSVLSKYLKESTDKVYSFCKK